MLSATTFQGYKKCCMLAMDVWCFSKSTIRVDLEKHQTRLHYWGNSLCNFEEAPLQFWVFLLCTKQIQGKYHQVMKQFQKLPLVILDEFLLIPASDQEQRDLLELMEYRCGQVSTIFCSQFMPEGWHERLGGSALADSILDRIIPSAYTMRIDGDVSMRQRKRMIKN